MNCKEKIEGWRVAVISSAITLGIVIIIIFTIAVIQTGTVESIKEAIEEDYCRNISITEARDLEACNENN